MGDMRFDKPKATGPLHRDALKVVFESGNCHYPFVRPLEVGDPRSALGILRVHIVQIVLAFVV